MSGAIPAVLRGDSRGMAGCSGVGGNGAALANIFNGQVITHVNSGEGKTWHLTTQIFNTSPWDECRAQVNNVLCTSCSVWSGGRYIER